MCIGNINYLLETSPIFEPTDLQILRDSMSYNNFTYHFLLGLCDNFFLRWCIFDMPVGDARDIGNKISDFLIRFHIGIIYLIIILINQTDPSQHVLFIGFHELAVNCYELITTITIIMCGLFIRFICFVSSLLFILLLV